MKILDSVKNKSFLLFKNNLKPDRPLNVWNVIIFFFLTFFLFYSYTKHFIYWDIFTFRDIHRSLGWLEGRFHWPGPDMSSGNNLPGPFFYFLLFPSLIFGSDIYGQSLLWHVIWLSSTYTVAFYFITKITVYKESTLIFFITFIAIYGKDICYPFRWAWNPSFAIMFHVLAIMNLYSYVETKKNSYLYLTGLVLALGVQVHFLVLIHAITPFIFYCLRKSKELKPILLFLFIISSPFLIYAGMDYFNFFETHTFYIGHLKELKENIFSEKWFRNIKLVFSFSYAVPIIGLLTLTLWNKWKTKKWLISKSTEELFIIISVPLLLVSLLAYKHWYTLWVPVFLMLFFTKWCDDCMSSDRINKIKFLSVFGALFVVSSLIFNNKILFDLSFQWFFKILDSNTIFLFIPMVCFFLCS